MEVNQEEIEELFKSGLNCSQIVFSQFSPKYNLSREQAISIGCGLGGGGREGELCGAVSGAIMVIGLKYGNHRAEDKESKGECYRRTKEFTGIYKERNGSIRCKDLLGYDLSTEEGMREAQERNIFLKVCIEKITSAVQILTELGY